MFDCEADTKGIPDIQVNKNIVGKNNKEETEQEENYLGREQ